MKTIVKRLEIYRLENKMTQERLANELDVAFCTVNRWFRGRNNPNKIQEYHIAKLILKKGV
jgi:transcriptional regulator with XRE-family HTH domain